MATNDREQERQRELDAYRVRTRETMQAFSDKALAFQSSIIIGGIDREECDRETVRRTDPERFALIKDVGRYCPCGIDLYRNGCYRCLHARGAVYHYDPNATCANCGAHIPLSGHACEAVQR